MEMRGRIKQIISEIVYGLKKSTFNELPFDYQRALMTYMITGEPVEWDSDTPSPDDVDWFNKEQVQHLINQYSETHGDKVFEYGIMSTQEIIDGVMTSLEDWDNFGEYHKWYQGLGGTDHGDSVFPIILNELPLPPGFEFIEDGWHRFHSYVSKGLEYIPVVRFT